MLTPISLSSSMHRLHVSKTVEEKARFKESQRLSTAKWLQNKKESRTKSANPNISVSQKAQASCNQSANRESTSYQQIVDDKAGDIADDISDNIADVPSFASCEPPNTLRSIDKTIETVRFCDNGDWSNSSDSDDVALSTKSL